tara:strand:- start:102 stop:770 length:669 start_codon:yes stop_codon:yes gene_type:complete
MIKPIRFLSLIILLLLLSTYSPTYKQNNLNLIFPIKDIKIKNIKILDSKKIINELEIIKGKNLLFVDKQIIRSVMEKFDFISSFNVKKIYPETIEIVIFEKKPVAIYIQKKKKFYISEKGDLIKYLEIANYNDLPLLFGKKKNFNIFFRDLKNINFPIYDIESFHYFEIGRWDIALKDEIIVKLPQSNYIDVLENFLLIKNDKSFEKYKIFDYRIKDQLILN